MPAPRYDVFRIGTTYYVIDVVENRVVSRPLYSRREGERQRDLMTNQDKLLAQTSSERMEALVGQVVHPQPGDVNYVPPATPPKGA